MLISVEEAQHLILSAITCRKEAHRVPLAQALGERLAEEVRAMDPIPPFTNTSMDGYAVYAEDTLGATTAHPITLAIIGTIRAGQQDMPQATRGQCVKIMTGAKVPSWSNAVIPIEWTETTDDHQSVRLTQSVTSGAHLRYQGEDMVVGDAVLAPHTLITSPVVGMLATLGVHHPAVIKRPRIGILATGDELRDIDQPLEEGTIRNSNSHALSAAITEAGGDPVLYPTAPDNPEAIRHLFRQAAMECDLLISSGGVSVGDYDFVKPVIEELGTLHLWRVNVKPGKPLAFGYVLDKPILGLPGNPVSALITFELFVRPAIRLMLGSPTLMRPQLSLPLAQAFTQIEDRRHYVRTKLGIRQGELFLHPHDNQGSAIQTSWLDVDALMIVPEHSGPYQAGDVLSALLLSLDHVESL